MLSAGVEHMLDCEIDLSIQSISIENGASSESKLDNFEPEVIVLEERICLSGYRNLMRLLSTYPYLPVIVVSTNDNVIHVYNPQELFLTRASDFTNVLRNI